MTEPDPHMIDAALAAAALSPCRSKRGVALYDPDNGAFRGAGHNGPPAGAPCPGRAICAGTCGQRSVHAEIRALRAAEVYRTMGHPPGPYDLVHVELDADGGVFACDGPRCPGCAVQILDVGFVGGVWLYELGVPPGELAEATRLGIAVMLRSYWRYYTAEDFHRVTLRNTGIRT